MTTGSRDIVCVSTGTLTEMQARHGVLSAAGIDSRVVGNDRTAGLGTALPGTVELWVNRDDLRAAMEQLAGPVPEYGEPHEHPRSDTVLDLSPDAQRGST